MKQRKNFNKGLRLDLACCRDDLRPAFEYLFIQDGFVYACDSHVLIANKLTECSTFTEEQIKALEGKLIHYKTYNEIIKHNKPFIQDDGILISEDGFRKMLYFGGEYLTYPNVRDLVKEIMESKSEECVDFGISFEHISIIRKCLPRSNKVKITSKDKYRYLITSLETSHESFAILMAVHTEGFIDEQ